MSPAHEPSLADKVAFLSQSCAYADGTAPVVRHETHMSWVFLAGAYAYKLKKPVRFAYLDFSTLERREAACRTELRLNQRLALDTYLDVVPLTRSAAGLAIGGGGTPVDWLVAMRRLEERRTIEDAILGGWIERRHLNGIAAALVPFYRGATRLFVSPDRHAAEWRRIVCENHRLLLADRFGLPENPIWRVYRTQMRYLARRRELLAGRVRKRRIVDGHGDLRPEHIWLDDRVRIIDCLEFNAALRAVDVLDELAFFDVECERLGGGAAGAYLVQRVLEALHDDAPEDLFRFYRCYRATLRARLAIAHLAEPNPRTPEKWLKVARIYLKIAARDAALLERGFKRPAGRRANALRGAGVWLHP